MSALDSVVERLGRGIAARTSRRSFLAQAGRVAVVVAGGSAVSLALEEPAIARVCGQSGVAPKCATYDCDATWGWCWYARGCCADGALKKICDCCAPNTPHPVGYCPSGTRVKCIVESCGADPRLQTRIIRRLRSYDPVELSITVSQTRFPGTRPVAILGDAAEPGFAALAAGLTRIADAPVVLSAPDLLDGRADEELARLAPEFVLLVGRFSLAVEATLVAQGRTVRRLTSDADPIPASAEVGRWVRETTGARTAIVVMPGLPYGAVAQAGAFAAAKAWPLLVGDAPVTQAVLRGGEAVHRTYVVTDDPAHADRFPGGIALAGPDLPALAIAIADRMVVDEAVSKDTVMLTPAGNAAAAAGLAAMGAPILTYRPGTLDGAWNWLHAHRAGVHRAFVAGSAEEFGSRPYYDLQSLLNEFEAHLLRGRGGEGLPVISQPRSERPIGKARR